MRSGPISRVLSWAIIYLARMSPCDSARATRVQAGPAHSTPICACSEWGLPSRHIATTLVVSYTTVSAFPFTPRRRWESSFLRHFPSGRPAWPLASILPCGARTFLTCRHAACAIAWPASQGPILPRLRAKGRATRRHHTVCTFASLPLSR